MFVVLEGGRKLKVSFGGNELSPRYFKPKLKPKAISMCYFLHFYISKPKRGVNRRLPKGMVERIR